MISLADMRLFVQVVKSGSIKEAAAVLHKTPAAVSLAIQRFEEELGLMLFDRSNYRLRLTDDGSRIYEQAIKVAREAGAFESFARTLAEQGGSRLRLATHSSISMDAIYPLLSVLKRELPNCDLDIRSSEVDLPLAQLIDEVVDLAVLVHPGVADPSGQTVNRLLGQMHFVNLAPIGADDSFAETLPQIVLSNFYTSEQTVYQVRDGITRWRVNSYQHKIDLIKQGLGWGFVPDYLAQEPLGNSIVREVAGGDGASRKGCDIRLYRLVGKPLNSAAELLWETALEPSAEVALADL